MLSLFRADLLKTRKRAMGWAMLAVGLTMIVLLVGVALLAPGEARAELPSFAFPGGLLVGAQVTSQLGGLLMVVFGATLVGSEYGYDTWKNLLTRRPGRGVFIIGKWATMALALLIGATVLPLWAQALGLVFGGLLPAADGPAPSLLGVVLQIAGGLPAPLVAGGVAMLGAVLGRSSAGGIVTGIVWMLADSLLAQLLPGVLKPLTFAFVSGSLSAQFAGAPAPIDFFVSAPVVLIYLIIPPFVAAHLFRSRDLA